jgi:hypothetical protein
VFVPCFFMPGIFDTGENMHHVMNVGVGLTILLWVLPVSAQVYTCVGKNGKLIVADRLVPECADKAVKELDRRGVLVREIPAPMTAEERQQQAAAEQQEEQRRIQEEAHQRQEQAVIARYQNVQEIEAARHKDITQITQRIAERDAAVLSAGQQVQAAAQALAQYATNAIPQTLQRQFNEAQRGLAEQQRLANALRREKDQINQRYDADLSMFRKATAAASAQSRQP